jgi:hypothetical protein
VAAGLTQQFTVSGTNTDGSAATLGAVTWASSNSAVATIDAGGLATTSAQGSSTITAAVGGVTSAGVTLTVTVPIPVAPTLNAPQAGSGQVALSWAAVTNATSYNVYYSTGATAVNTAGAVLATVAGTSYTHTGLTNGTVYNYAATASNSSGASPASATVSATPSLAAVTGFTAADGVAQVDLAWTNPTTPGFTATRIVSSTAGYPASPVADNLTTFVVYDGPATSTMDTAIIAGGTYYYTAFAHDGASNFAAGVQATATHLAAPTGVSATPGSGRVTLTWSAVSGATGYNIYWGTSASVAKGTGTPLTAANSPYTHTGLTNGSGYYYVLTAVNGSGGEGAGSAQVGPAIPSLAPVTGATAVAANGTSTLSWTNPTTAGFTAVTIRRDTAGYPASPAAGTAVCDCTATSSVAESGLTDGTLYYYSLFAHDAVPNYAAAAQISVTPADTIVTPWALTSSSTVSNANNTLAITGICEAGGVVSLSGSAASSTACAAGTFGFNPVDNTATSNVDAYSLQATDAAANVSSILTVTWTRTIPPLAAPVITLPAETVPGSKTTYSNVGIVALAGTCIGNYTVTLSGASSATTPCGNGQFSFLIATPGADVTQNFFITQSDYSGTASAAAQRTWVYDTTKPAAVVLQNPTTSPSVTANTNNFILSGTCELNATVFLTGSSTQSQVCSAGTFSFTATQTVDGTYTFSLAQQDRAGNASTAVTQDWVRDSTFVPTPAFDAAVAIPTYTDDTADIVLTGTCVAPLSGEIVVLYLEDGITQLPSLLDDSTSPTATNYPYRALCSAGGTFSMNLNNSNAGGTAGTYWDQATQSLVNAPLPAGTYPWSLVAYRSNDGGQTWFASAGVYYEAVVNMTPPPAPSTTVPLAIAAGGTGSYVAPGPLAIGGGCGVGNTVTLAGGVSAKTPVLCDAAGAYSFASVDETVDGTYAYTLTQTSLAGVVSTAATTFNWTRLTGALPPPIVTSPATNPYTSNTGSLVLSGTCTSGLFVRLTEAAVVIQSYTCAGGTFFFTVNKTTTPNTVVTYNFGLYQEDSVATTSTTVAFQWIVDTTPPTITATYALPFATSTASSAGVPLVSPAKDAVFEFISNSAGTFECNLDGAGYVACTTPAVYSGLAAGVTHSLLIQAKDLAGNVSLVPYARYWTQQVHGTVMLYHLDEAATGATAIDSAAYQSDASPYNYNSPLSATSTTVTTHAGFGNARGVSLGAATGQYLMAPDAVHHGSLRTKMTIEAWVQPDTSANKISKILTRVAGNTYEGVLASKWDTTNNRMAWEFGLQRTSAVTTTTDTKTVTLFFRTYTQTTATTTPTLVTALSPAIANFSNQALAHAFPFEHLAMTWDRGVVNFFDNGVLLGTATPGNPGVSLLPDGDGQFLLSAGSTSATAHYHYFQGTLDEVRIAQDVCYIVGALPTAPFTDADCVPQ